MNYSKYESEKRKIEVLNLDPKEYQKRVRALAKKLGI